MSMFICIKFQQLHVIARGNSFTVFLESKCTTFGCDPARNFE